MERLHGAGAGSGGSGGGGGGRVDEARETVWTLDGAPLDSAGRPTSGKAALGSVLSTL